MLPSGKGTVGRRSPFHDSQGAGTNWLGRGALLPWNGSRRPQHPRGLRESGRTMRPWGARRPMDRRMPRRGGRCCVTPRLPHLPPYLLPIRPRAVDRAGTRPATRARNPAPQVRDGTPQVGNRTRSAGIEPRLSPGSAPRRPARGLLGPPRPTDGQSRYGGFYTGRAAGLVAQATSGALAAPSRSPAVDYVKSSIGPSA